MKYKSLLLIVVTVLFLGGCGMKKNNLTVEQQLKQNSKSDFKTYTFKNRTKLEVVKAIENMFNHLDKSDYRLDIQGSKIVVNRMSTLYAILAYVVNNSVYTIEVKEKDNNIILTTNILLYTDNVVINSIETSYPFEFFYNRVEYFLNIDNPNNPYQWVSCDEAEKKADKFNNQDTDSGIFSFCFMADDIKPNSRNNKNNIK